MPQQANEEPSPEELMALVELLQQQGLNMDQVPPDLKTMLDNVRRQKAAKSGAVSPSDAPTEEITPNPGFVIKTSEVASGRKVFINVCSSERVAAPGGWDNGVMPDEVAAALDKLQSGEGEGGAAALSPGDVEALRFPLSCGPARLDTDRKGAPCTCVDVVFNADVVRAAAVNRKLKAMLIEVSTGWVANKMGCELDPRYKLPRMRYKGEVVASQRIRADDKRKKLVTELRDVDEEPSFALRARRASQPPPAPPSPPATSPRHAAELGPSARGFAGAVAATAGTTQSVPSGSKPAAATAAQAPMGTARQTAAVSAARTAGLMGVAGHAGPPYKIEYEGRPVEWIRVMVDMPCSTQLGSDLAVEVCGRTLFVRQPSQPELQVPLLFAVSAEGATASWQAAAAGSGPGAKGQLVVRLPYRSMAEYLLDGRAQAPLAFGQLSFASKALLELEP